MWDVAGVSHFEPAVYINGDDWSQGCGSNSDCVRQSRIILPDPGVLHLCKFSVILMRFCMSSNSSASSTGQGEMKHGHLQGRCAEGRVTLHWATCTMAQGSRKKPDMLLLERSEMKARVQNGA